MAEKGLDDPQVRAVGEQVAGKGVAQHMGRERGGIEPCGTGEVLEVQCRVLARQVPARSR